MRHRIELPPLQVSETSTSSGQQTVQKWERPAKVVTAFNAGLSTAEGHIKALRAILTEEENEAVWSEPVFRQRPLLLYFYCHASPRVKRKFASKMGELLIEEFLQDKWAGDALLDARWALLTRYNVLGLLYTLYAPVNLHLPRRPGARDGTALLVNPRGSDASR